MMGRRRDTRLPSEGEDAAELILTIPNDHRGNEAIRRLRDGEASLFGAEYLGDASDRLVGLRAAQMAREHQLTFHLVAAKNGDETAVANRFLNWRDDQGEAFISEVELNLYLALSATHTPLGIPFHLGGDHLAYLRQMKLDKAPATSTGSGVKVAVIDSGIDGASSVAPFAFYDVEKTPWGPHVASDPDGHGTAMATLIRAVSPDAEIGVVRAFDAKGKLPAWNLMLALLIAAYDCDASIINLSLGLRKFPLKCSGCGATLSVRLGCFDKLIAEIDRLRGADAPIYVAATGNDSSTTGFDYPAFQEDTVAVGSVTVSGNRSSFSNYGTLMHRWHFMAPGGEEKPSTGVTEYVGMGSSGEKCRGTSPATAYASGMLALLRSEMRYATKSRSDFLDDVARDHCEFKPGMPAIEQGAGQIVYVTTARAAAAVTP